MVIWRLPILHKSVRYRRVVSCAHFKRSFGVPVRRYLLYKRVEAAKALLLHSNGSLLTIALEVGFTDQPAFNRSFRKIVGTSPGRWRRANAPMPKEFNLPAPEEK